MKKFIIPALFVLVCCVGCLKSKTTWNGPVVVDFSSGNWAYYNDDVLFGDTTVFHPYPFAYGELSFNNTHNEDGDFLGGFSVGHVRDTTFATREEGKAFNRFTVFDTTKTPANSGAVYGRFAIFSACEPAQEGDIFFAYANVGTCTPNTCAVANTTLNVAKILGFEGETPFAEGDWIKLSITGVKGETASEPVNVMLADFREGKQEYVKGWLAVDISKIGNFDVLKFAITSNRTDISPDVCLDDLYVTVAVSY